MTAAIGQVKGRDGLFLKAQEQCKRYSTLAQCNGDCLVQRQRAFLEQGRRVAQTISSYFNKQRFIAVLEEYFQTYITERVGRVHDCYIAEVTDNSSRIKMIEVDEQLISIICSYCYVL